ncbi:MAG: bifunctional diguanylate cyclase/phosphodiesterase [Proteobacteria bacterium]|nr:bifunctional diguanylate cyclase/phosphodiesterase [Pseudomonadota bacterium]MDA1357032.1 bifunctional diguanylate cyclase/phosphodiesterase [Pseudomonadota bacterium]
METSHDRFALHTTEISQSRLTELEAELSKSHDNLGRLASQLDRVNRDFERLTSYDLLTGLANRTLFYDQLSGFIAIARREKRKLPLLVLDVNAFKDVNDGLGHQAGDHVLKEVAVRISEVERDSDTAARLGGDEFAVVLPTTATIDGAMVVAQKIASAVEAPMLVDGHRLLLGVSIGISLYPDNGSDDKGLVSLALVAMNEAKRSGGGFVACAPDQNRSPSGKLILAGDIRDAIDHNELTLHYQPKVAMNDGRVIGAEALVRWNHPKQGLIYPDNFIPLVERTGLINSLTLAVLDAALAQARIWQLAGKPKSISVNLSSRVLHDASLPEHVSERLKFHQIPPDCLILEITETAIMIDADKAMEVVTSLAELGVGIAIDDFGTGYSSLSYLRRLPAQEIKIDRSFVLNMHKNADDKTIVRSVIDLANNLGMKVVAEGVENREIYDLLKDMDCYCAQGYYISRPVDEDKFSDWLDDPHWGEPEPGVACEPASVPAEKI